MLTKKNFEAIEEHTGVIKGVIIKEFAKALCYGGGGVTPMLVKEEDVWVTLDEANNVSVGFKDDPENPEDVTRSIKLILKNAGYPTMEKEQEDHYDEKNFLAVITPEVVFARMLIDTYSAF